jgi:hypothetical protein
LTRPVRVFAADLGRAFSLGDDFLLPPDLNDAMEELDGLLEGGELAAVNGVAGYFFRTALVTTGVFD